MRVKTCSLFAFLGILLMVLGIWGLLWARDSLRYHWRAVAESRAQSRELLEMEVECPPGAEKVGRAHAQVGWMMYCESAGLEHGPWLVAEFGKIIIRGKYRDGKRYGTWEYYDKEGSVTRRVTYDEEE